MASSENRNPNLLNKFNIIKMMFGKKKSNTPEYKFCPSCGMKLQLTDTFCVKCGYSFAERSNQKKKIKKRNVWIIVSILVIAYFGLRYANGQTLIPRSFADALRTIIPIP